MAVGALAGLRLVSFEARRAEELATMLVRHGAEVVRAPALREEPLGPSAATLELARRLEAGEVDLVVLLTGVGTRALAAALADACPYLGALLARTRIVARGPKPLAALARGEAEVAVFTNAAQVEHLFRAATDPEALRRGLAHAVVASVGPVCTEALEAHGIAPDLEASPPKMGPLVALVAARTRALLAAKRGARAR